MSWRLAKSLETLRSQVNAAYPNRNKASDGTIGDAAHRNTVSQHNPNAAGVVTAIDITHDPANGVDGQALADLVIQDPRAWYVIFNGRIRYHGGSWQKYNGTNPHRTHMHLSTNQSASRYDDNSNWNIGGDMLDEEGAKELYRLGLHREPENDSVWRAWVGKKPSEAMRHFRGTKEFLGQNHIQKVAYPQSLGEIEALKKQLEGNSQYVEVKEKLYRRK